MDPFGQRLKEIRQRRGLSQAELGGHNYSASYVSLLESGRRSPTDEIVEFLATQLQVDAADLNGASELKRARDSGAQQIAVLQLNARTAWEHGEHAQAWALADRARQAATAMDRPDSWWSATHLMAQALFVLEDYGRSIELAQELIQHPLARDSVELEVESRVLASKACRAAGRLKDALAYAEEADRIAPDASVDTSWRVHAMLAHLAALGELGRTEDMQDVADRLRDLRPHLTSPHLQGLVAWSLGNLAFLTGSIETGIAEHDVATQTLNPESDLRAWGRFCKASLAMRLSAGSTAGADELLARAQYAMTLVGNDGDRRELDLTRADLLLHKGKPAETLAILDELADPDAPMPAHTRAEAEWLRHRTLKALGDVAQARDAAAAAALAFEEAGAIRRALEAWRTHAGVELTPHR